MVPEFPLRENLAAIQAKMQTDFDHATSTIKHHGAKGREREALAVKSYLSTYLPATVAVVHGAEILDSEGNRSAECDIVIEDASTPPLFLSDTFQIIPVEWAYGVIEVKSNLNSVTSPTVCIHLIILQAWVRSPPALLSPTQQRVWREIEAFA